MENMLRERWKKDKMTFNHILKIAEQLFVSLCLKQQLSAEQKEDDPPTPRVFSTWDRFGNGTQSLVWVSLFFGFINRRNISFTIHLLRGKCGLLKIDNGVFKLILIELERFGLNRRYNYKSETNDSPMATCAPKQQNSYSIYNFAPRERDDSGCEKKRTLRRRFVNGEVKN